MERDPRAHLVDILEASHNDIVDDEAVWSAITVDLPSLISHVSTLLGELEA